MKPKLPNWAHPHCRLIPSEIRQDIQRLIDEAYAAGMMDAREWRPIESAPKDGKPFLAWRREQVATACLVPRNDCEMWTFGFTSASVEHYPEIKPSHWMHLPPPPEQPK